MKNVKKIFILFCAVLLLTGCSAQETNEKNEQTETAEKTANTEQTAAYMMVRL